MEVSVKVKESMLGKVIELSASVLVLGIVMGYIAIPIFMGTNTSGWSATNILIWGTIITISLAAVIMLFIRMFQHHGAE
jgi:hypothetical protein